MRILFVIDSLGSGGAQRQLVELAIGFKEKGHSVSFLIYHNLIFYKEILNEELIDIQVINESSFLIRFIRMRSSIRTIKPDAVISFLDSPNFLCVLSGFPFRKWKLLIGERSSNPNMLKNIHQYFFKFFHLFADWSGVKFK